MRRRGDPIQAAGLRRRLSHGITFSARYEQIDAAIAAGMDLERWVGNKYDRRLMADVVAWHRLHGMIEAHLDDARARDYEKQSARRKGRR